MKRTGWLWAWALVIAGLASGSLDGAAAQDAVATDPNAQAKAATEAAELRARRLKANAEAREAMGLPSYSGRATVGEHAGRLEASLLAAEAVGSASRAIATALGNDGNYVVLAGDENFDLGIVGAIQSQISALKLQLEAAVAPPVTPRRNGSRYLYQMGGEQLMVAQTASGITDAVGLATTVLGAIRSEVEVRGIAEVGVDDALLARAVAARLETRARLPSAPRLSPPSSPIETSFLALARLRDRAEMLRQELEGNEAQAQRLATVKLALTRYDAFFTFATTPDEQGVMPIGRAIILEDLMKGAAPPRILRVSVELAGGSMTNSVNIGSYLGLDPIRVSGGLVASYVATDAQNGSLVKAGVIACRTGLVRLRRVHDGSWRRIAPNRSAPAHDCVDALGPQG